MIIWISRMEGEPEKSPATVYIDGEKFSEVETEGNTMTKVEGQGRVSFRVECAGFSKAVEVNSDGRHDADIQLQWLDDPKDLTLAVKYFER